ncbi:SRPBCC domain-containing protein [Paenarthrobacter sp. NPDC092416]|uniref:SRPBCC family protein n=1 Tax=Paenarthrobacter sp. NPDC092416 TaxID=3364386 RepID=UPI00382E6268
MKQYFLGTNVSSSWKEGEPITFSGEWNGKSYKDKGIILDITPLELLRISHYSPLTGLPDVPENYHTVEYRLQEAGAGTTVTITQGNNKSDAEADESSATWRLILQNLKEFLEGKD